MKCSQAQQWISRWLDADLDKEHIALLEEHMNACPQCSQVYTEWAENRRALRAYPTISPSADFDHRVWQRVSNWTPTAHYLSPLARLAWAGATGLAIAISLLIVMRWTAPPPQSLEQILWMGGRETAELVRTLLGPEGGDNEWQGGSSSGLYLPLCLWWRS